MGHTNLVPDYRFQNWEKETIFLREVNAELLQACKYALSHNGYNGNYLWHKSRTMIEQAIIKAEGV